MNERSDKLRGQEAAEAADESVDAAEMGLKRALESIKTQLVSGAENVNDLVVEANQCYVAVQALTKPTMQANAVVANQLSNWLAGLPEEQELEYLHKINTAAIRHRSKEMDILAVIVRPLTVDKQVTKVTRMDARIKYISAIRTLYDLMDKLPESREEIEGRLVQAKKLVEYVDFEDIDEPMASSLASTLKFDESFIYAQTAQLHQKLGDGENPIVQENLETEVALLAESAEFAAKAGDPDKAIATSNRQYGRMLDNDIGDHAETAGKLRELRTAIDDHSDALGETLTIHRHYNAISRTLQALIKSGAPKEEVSNLFTEFTENPNYNGSEWVIPLVEEYLQD